MNNSAESIVKPKYDAQYFVSKLAAAGVPAEQIPLLVGQIAHETANFKDRKLNEYNNAAGITYSKTFFDPKDNVTVGRPLPENGKYYYAIFPNIDTYIKYYLKILKRKPHEPIKATSPRDFVARLKAQNYFTGNPDVYLSSVAFFANKYKNLKPLPLFSLLVIALLSAIYIK